MYSRTRIKVCGMTTVEDAEEAIRLGVDAIGFIFAEQSRRYISPDKVKEIVACLPPFIHLIGVFVDSDPVEVEEIIDYCGLTHVQLHGRESVEYCHKLAQSVSPCRVIKAFRVSPQTSAADFAPYEESVGGYLLDTFATEQAGGTGQTFDWSRIESFKAKRPIVLAGGLCPENIAEAIRQVRPFAVDVNSGVEIEPGRKDYGRLYQLVQLVQAIDRE
ncbi:MAG: phosphoribosylanthranilate isomerase [Desulfopila sp.]